jgi:hypothetical protein
MGRIDNAAVLVCACLYESDRVLRLCTVKVRKNTNESYPDLNLKRLSTSSFLLYSLSYSLFLFFSFIFSPPLLYFFTLLYIPHTLPTFLPPFFIHFLITYHVSLQYDHSYHFILSYFISCHHYLYQVIANIVCNPSIRKIILADKQACNAIKKMSHMKENGGDNLLARHAKIAVDAVNWTP